MRHWKPKNFKPEFPAPEDGCAFVLGGSLHGEIMQEFPLPRYYRHAAPTVGGTAIEETYRLEKFRVGDPHRSMWFYVHEGEPTGPLLIRALTELCNFKRSARCDAGA